MGADFNMENTIQEIHRAVIRIENDHGKKLDALLGLFDSSNRTVESTNQKLVSDKQKLESIDE